MSEQYQQQVVQFKAAAIFLKDTLDIDYQEQLEIITRELMPDRKPSDPLFMSTGYYSEHIRHKTKWTPKIFKMLTILDNYIVEKDYGWDSISSSYKPLQKEDLSDLQLLIKSMKGTWTAISYQIPLEIIPIEEDTCLIQPIIFKNEKDITLVCESSTTELKRVDFIGGSKLVIEFADRLKMHIFIITIGGKSFRELSKILVLKALYLYSDNEMIQAQESFLVRDFKAIRRTTLKAIMIERYYPELLKLIKYKNILIDDFRVDYSEYHRPQVKKPR